VAPGTVPNPIKARPKRLAVPARAVEVMITLHPWVGPSRCRGPARVIRMTGVRSHVVDAACNENAESDGTLRGPLFTILQRKERCITDDHSDAMLFPLDARKIDPFENSTPLRASRSPHRVSTPFRISPASRSRTGTSDALDFDDASDPLGFPDRHF